MRFASRGVALLMVAVAPVVPAQAPVRLQEFRSRVVCVVDATTRSAVAYARVRGEAEGITDLVTADNGCAMFTRSDEWPSGARFTVSRIGFVAQTVRLAPHRVQQRADTTFVQLQPLAALLTSSQIVGAAPLLASSGERNAVTVNADSARAVGVATTGALVSLLPYTFPRSARGEVTLSLRGARREQVAVTLDGISLSDPATGMADLADVPLAMLGAATVSPGSDALNTGPGAAGGVLALTSSNASVASVRMAAFGDALMEGAWGTTLRGARLRVGGSHRAAQNDFAFVNNASTTGSAATERRVNNDVLRSSAMLQLETSRAQVLVLASRASLGLVGPVNVRDYDEDRSQTTRIFSRGTLQAGRAMLSMSARAFSLSYRDPSRPVFNSLAEAVATDLDARSRVKGVVVHTGIGGDALRASQDVRQMRARAFASAQTAREAHGLLYSGGVRVDVVSESGALPSFSLTAQHERPQFTGGARLGQAVRVPTLYDLYFSSPQRLAVRALRPERVVLDAELFARWRPLWTGAWRVSVDAALVQRDTRNAIVWFPGNFGWSPSNVGREHMHGFETRVSLEHARASVSAWSTAYAPTLVSGALRIPTPYVPANAGGGNARVAFGPVQLGVAARVLGERPFTAGPRDAAFMLPVVSLFDGSMSALRSFSGLDALVSLALDNITNRAWQSVRGFPSPGRSWSVAFTIRPTAP